ncbi:lactoylglutathione lyase [Chitinophaga costaii]|uniref:Lactoylglutathione lyase n=1 Tax=Chitinophaga costaii TaxID=1335309 RepID=A0A1C4G122_9BACT|nr:VOC family protein [Chitinophaga costaii]PUZ19968.1 glyoxalase [Chitinophaga costaii]SCC61633.1 lactoylglutathione lyase [Chitinophaga costaii]
MQKIFFTSLLLLAGLTGQTMTAVAQKNSTPQINHIALYVFDLDKSTAFYTKILQLDTIPEPFHDGRHTWLRIGAHSQLHIIQGAAGITQHDKNSHLCFSVPDLQVFMHHLEENHIAYGNWAQNAHTPTLRPDGVKQIYFTDPDGYWLEVNDDTF